MFVYAVMHISSPVSVKYTHVLAPIESSGEKKGEGGLFKAALSVTFDLFILEIMFLFYQV